MLLSIFNQRHNISFKYPNFTGRNCQEKIQFIQNFITRIIVQTEGQFDFNMQLQMIDQFNIELNTEELETTLTSKMDESLLLDEFVS